MRFAITGSRVAVWLSEHLLGATFTVECEDASSVDGKRGYVIVCNHQSSLDAGAIHKLNLSGHIGPTRDRTGGFAGFLRELWSFFHHKLNNSYRVTFLVS